MFNSKTPIPFDDLTEKELLVKMVEYQKKIQYDVSTMTTIIAITFVLSIIAGIMMAM